MLQRRFLESSKKFVKNVLANIHGNNGREIKFRDYLKTM
jgi:hypothetical protein